MDAKLIIVGGKVNKRVVQLKLPAVIGRGRDAQLTVAHPMVSRQHCELFEQEGLLAVRDLGSLNGTRIDGKRIKQATLCPNGEFTIGPLTFMAQYEYQGDLSSVPPPEFVATNGKPEPETVAEPEAQPEEEVCSEAAGSPSSFDSAMLKQPDLSFLDESAAEQTLDTPADQPAAEPQAAQPDLDLEATKEAEPSEAVSSGEEIESPEPRPQPAPTPSAAENLPQSNATEEPVAEATAEQADDVPDFLANLEADARPSPQVEEDGDLAEFLKGFQ